MIAFSKLSIKSNSAFFFKWCARFTHAIGVKWAQLGVKLATGLFLHEDSVSERVNYHVTFVFIIGQISLVILLVRFAGAEKRISGRNNLFYRRTKLIPSTSCPRMRDFVDPPHTRATRSAGNEFGSTEISSDDTNGLYLQ